MNADIRLLFLSLQDQWDGQQSREIINQYETLDNDLIKKSGMIWLNKLIKKLLNYLLANGWILKQNGWVQK
ncbi:MAG: hypothetical protein H7Y86_06860 [Rhizobacter sp.]|nr:hypothetical protein [Ferruginibacter sp.]